MSVGWPAECLLRDWAHSLYDMFGHMPYLVGSATKEKNTRDVDVVVLLPQDEYDHWAGPQGPIGARYYGLCTAISLWGQKVTGLNIDFKIQEVVTANDRHKGKVRDAIGIRITPEWVDPMFAKRNPGHPACIAWAEQEAQTA